jgi:RNA 2',3'-cyclic 3'-phosphodiesterase
MDHNASGSGRLFLAAVPDADTAARIYRLAEALKRAHKFGGKLIESERLHVSLFFLGGLSEHTVWMACEAATDARGQPFDVLFDRSASFRGRPGNRPFVLIGDGGLDRLRSFRRTLGVAMARRGLKRLVKNDFAPHITLLYAERNAEEQPIEPICWTVNEFVLIHSMHGHVHLARWPLRPASSTRCGMHVSGLAEVSDKDLAAVKTIEPDWF